MPGESALQHVTATQADDVLIVACGLSRSQQRLVLEGHQRRCKVSFIETFEAVEKYLLTTTRCDAMILAPRDAIGREATVTVERIARDWPGTAMVVFYPSRAQGPSPHMLLRAGAHDFVYEGQHRTAEDLALKVENARRECTGVGVFLQIQRLVPPSLQNMVREVLGRPHVLTSVEELAPFMGVHRKTLVNRCAREKFLPPAELIAWCRLAMVGYLLERTGATVESISLTLGFPSPTALRNQLKRYTGHTATSARAMGALGCVLRALECALREHRGLPME